ncbi:MAG: hypothetical protein D6698_15145 [Gammaproteobacteria bacterium]|nr:MAG: hypothetical protein D6698_15145 [Gammaproteobacteria bacterium]
MSFLILDQTNRPIQAFKLPVSGDSITITVSVAGSSGLASNLQAGVYRIISDADVTIAEGTIATANDMPIRANQPEYFYVRAGQSVSVYGATAPANIVLTRMP